MHILLISAWKTEYSRYVPQGSTDPTEYPQSIYGTEVFEVNDNLRQLAIGFAKTAVLNDSTDAMAYRANYASTSAYKAGSEGPSVVGCDSTTSDVYFSGTLLGEAFENTTRLFTNGSGVYCTTAQEDTATLEALLRGAIANLTDFSRIIIMRTASDFDRPYAGEVCTAAACFLIEMIPRAVRHIREAEVSSCCSRMAPSSDLYVERSNTDFISL